MNRYINILILLGITVITVFWCVDARSESLADKNDYWPVLTIGLESSGECYEGQVLVASVIKERMKDHRWPSTAKDVVCQYKQFSCHPATRTLSAKEWQTASRAWAESKPLGWNHYHATYCSPYWADTTKEHKRVGKHIFYKL